MVTTQLIGRLGNQMFQLAATIGTAIKHDTIYKIPQRSMDPSKWDVYFKNLPEYTENDTIDRIYKEQSFSYSEIEYKTGEHLCLDGYFQSEKYFKHCKNDIIRAFGFDYEMLAGAISIHVRRGDYLNYPTKHPVCTMDYYREAIKYFADKNYRLFVIYSDDMAWCRKEFKHPLFGEDVNFLYSSGNNELQDMESMSFCENNIIANSSFSWWAAWLNRNKNKTVIAPKQWFGVDMSHDTKDLIPESWIRM